MIPHIEVLQRGAKYWNTKLGLFIPHSFLFVILLTFLAYLLGILGAYQGPFDLIQFWVNGFWSLLAPSMQMLLMVVAGFSIGSSPLGQRIFRFLGSVPKTPRQGVILLIAFISAFSWIHWGVGIVAGAFLTREIGRRIAGIDYPLLVASAYIGMCTGTFGTLSVEPAAYGKAGHILERGLGVLPFTQGYFNALPLIGFAIGIGAVILLLAAICPEERMAVPPGPELLRRFRDEEQAESKSPEANGESHLGCRVPFGIWLENSRWPVWLIFTMGFSYIVYWFYSEGLALNMNIFNFLLICLALPFYDTPLRFLKSMERSNRAFYGILIQFPFYAGIQGMLLSSGMAPILFEWMTSRATAATYFFWVYLDGAVINFFVPTAGGIWEIHNALVVQKAAERGVGIARALHAFNAGGVIGNIIQPFWAIPLLGICGLSLRDIMGYCLMAFLTLSFVWVLFLFFWPL